MPRIFDQNHDTVFTYRAAADDDGNVTYAIREITLDGPSMRDCAASAVELSPHHHIGVFGNDEEWVTYFGLRITASDDASSFGS
jgi:hypothetical protein